MPLSQDEQLFAAYYIVGYGTEIGGIDPYSVQLSTSNSGYSFGVTQTDLSQRSDERTELYIEYDIWRTDQAAAGNVYSEITLDQLTYSNNSSLSKQSR